MRWARRGGGGRPSGGERERKEVREQGLEEGEGGLLQPVTRGDPTGREAAGRRMPDPSPLRGRWWSSGLLLSCEGEGVCEKGSGEERLTCGRRLRESEGVRPAGGASRLLFFQTQGPRAFPSSSRTSPRKHPKSSTAPVRSRSPDFPCQPGTSAWSLRMSKTVLAELRVKFDPPPRKKRTRIFLCPPLFCLSLNTS